MCRAGAAAAPGMHVHSTPAGGLRTPTGRGARERRGHGQNPPGEPPHTKDGPRFLRPCRFGEACRGISTYCRFTHPKIQVGSDDWQTVHRKRRRSIRFAAPLVDDEIIIDDDIFDHLNDIEIANQHEGHSAISATDAPMHSELSEFRSGMSDMSQDLVPDSPELQSPTGSGLRCLTPESRDSACALDNSMDRDFCFDSASDDDSDHAPRAMTRVDGCVSLLPFGIQSHNQKITGQSISF